MVRWLRFLAKKESGDRLGFLVMVCRLGLVVFRVSLGFGFRVWEEKVYG